MNLLDCVDICLICFAFSHGINIISKYDSVDDVIHVYTNGMSNSIYKH